MSSHFTRLRLLEPAATQVAGVCLVNVYRVCLFPKAGETKEYRLVCALQPSPQHRGVFTALGSRKSSFVRKRFLCHRKTCPLAADLPGVPAICFRVIFICGDEFDLSLGEICKCFLMSALNIQLKQKKNTLKKQNQKQQTIPQHTAEHQEQDDRQGNRNLRPWDSPDIPQTAPQT